MLASPSAAARRTTATAADARRTTTFRDFLSDSDGDDDDPDGLARMQQQADDMTYFDASFGAGSPDDDLALDLRGVHGADDSDDDRDEPPRPPKPQAKAAPATSLRASASVRASTTFGRATMLRRLTSGRRKSKAAKVDKSDLESVLLGRATSGGAGRKTLLQRMTIGRRNKSKNKSDAVDASGGVLLDSDESDESSDGGAEQSRLSDFSEHDSSFASADHSFRVDPDAEPSFVDKSFSEAMRGHDADADGDDDIYDHGSGYDDEVEEMGIREKAAHLHETEQEDSSSGASFAFTQRLSEEPFHESHDSHSHSPPPLADENPYTASSFDSVSSSGGNFFVESVRGSSDSIAPVMELSNSPASFSMDSGKGSISSSPASSFSGKGSLSSSPASMFARNSADLSFPTSFVPVSLMSPAPPAPPPPPSAQPQVASLGFRVVDHTQTPTPPVAASTAVYRSTLTRALDPRHSTSSSSSSSSLDDMDNMSFSSNIDDSFSGERPRTSSEDNLSLVFQQHVDSGSSGNPDAKTEKASLKVPKSPSNEKPESPREDEDLSFLALKRLSSEDPSPKEVDVSFLVKKHLSNAEVSPRDADLSFLAQKHLKSEEPSPKDADLSFLMQKHLPKEQTSPKDADLSFLMQKHLPKEQASPKDADDLSFVMQKHLPSEQLSTYEAEDTSFVALEHPSNDRDALPKESEELSFFGLEHLMHDRQSLKEVVGRTSSGVEESPPPAQLEDLFAFDARATVVKVEPKVEQEEPSLVKSSSHSSAPLISSGKPTESPTGMQLPPSVFDDSRTTVVKVEPKIEREEEPLVKSSSRPLAAAAVIAAEPLEGKMQPLPVFDDSRATVVKVESKVEKAEESLMKSSSRPLAAAAVTSVTAADLLEEKTQKPSVFDDSRVTVVKVEPKFEKAEEPLVKSSSRPLAAAAAASVTASVIGADPLEKKTQAAPVPKPVPATEVKQATPPLSEPPSVPATSASPHDVPVYKPLAPVVTVFSIKGNKPPVSIPLPAPTPSVDVAVPAIPVEVKEPNHSASAPGPTPSTNAADSATRKTAKFSKPLPPGRRRGPAAVAASSAAVVSSAVAATASLVGGKSPAASPPKSPSRIDLSIASSRPSDARLDFTGVFLGNPDGTTNSPPRQPAPPVTVEAPGLPIVVAETESEISFDDSAVASSNAGPPSVRRMVSAQEVSERKVEEFFRKTYVQSEDDDLSDFLLQGASTRGRSKTAANRAMAQAELGSSRRRDPMLSSTRSRRSSTSAMKMVDLKSLRSGQRIEELLRANEEETKDEDDEEYHDQGAAARKRTLSRPSARFPIKEDLLEVYPSRPSTASSAALARRAPPPPRPNEEPLTPITIYSVTSGSDVSSSIADSEIARPNQMLNSNVIQRNFTLSLASGTVGRSSFSVSDRSSPNEIPMPPNYMLSPRLNDNHRPSSSLGSFSSSSTNEGPTTPQLPVLSVTTRAVVPPTSLAASAVSNKFASSGVASSPFSASGVNDVAPGFRWHPELSQQKHAPGTKQSHESAWSSEDGSLSIKESVWHAAGALSIGGGRPSMAASVANHFQRASMTLKNSFRKVRSQFIPPNRGNNEFTSPKSICSAPPRLPRGFDDRQFYSRLGNIQCGDAIIVVSKAERGNPAKEQAIQHKRKTQAWLLFLGILLGIVVGVGLSHIDSLSSKFKPVVNTETGEMTLPTGTKWLLLPGSLFLRVWNCLTLPLLFCHVMNAVAELVMSQNAKNAISFRTLGYLAVTAALTTIEGVGLALVYHAMGLFKSRQVSLAATAASVKEAVNVLDRVKGMAAMMCGAEESYLQVSQNGQGWRCSNESIPLPVADGIKVTARGWNETSAAVFAFTQPPTGLPVKATTSVITSTSYYPAVSASVGDLVTELLGTLSPSNLVDSFSKSLASSVVVVALAFGLVVGTRAYHRSITAQHLLKQSQTQHPTQATMLAESILSKPHPVLGVVVELQQLLEWIVGAVQGLAPMGVASLLAGHIVLHRDEWFAVPGPVVSLLLGVVLACVVHVLVLSPLLVKLLTGVNAWRSLPSFLPALALSFGTGNVVLSVPLLAHNFASAQLVTKCMAQLAAGLGAAVLRSGHALYVPLALLFLLETTVPDGLVPLSPPLVLLLAALTFLSCFLPVGPGARLGVPGVTASATLQLVRLLFGAWTQQRLSGAATLPLLVAADALLSRAAAAVSTHDHVALAALLGDHCAELCLAPPDDALGVGASPVYL